MAERVASLWIGNRLTILEKLCLKSFYDIGQTPILYCYHPIENLPPYVEVRDARDVLPLDANGRIYVDPVNQSPAVHADLFRLHLLAKTDEIWVDCDAYALKPFQSLQGYLMAGRRDGQRRVPNGVLRLPRNSPALKAWMEMVSSTPCIPPWWDQRTHRMYRRLYGKKVTFSTLPLGTIGPISAYHFLLESGEIERVLPERELYALPFSSRREWTNEDTGQLDEFDWKSKTSIHFFSSVMRPRLARSRGRVLASSFFGGLLNQHGLADDPDVTLV
ncbi:MAG: hypothetical protein AB3N12_04530 [Ruegeria sp.]